LENTEKVSDSNEQEKVNKILRMAGFYIKLCPNFSSTVGSQTNLLQKKAKFDWTKDYSYE
jgi:hypothetical protein